MVEKVERLLTVMAVMALVSLTCRNQGGGSQLSEFLRRSLSEHAPKLQNATHRIFGVPTLPQRSQILLGERGCPIAEGEKAGSKVRFQQSDPFVIKFFPERLTSITVCFGVPSGLDHCQPAMEPLHQQRSQRIVTKRSERPRGIQVNYIRDRGHG